MVNEWKTELSSYLWHGGFAMHRELDWHLVWTVIIWRLTRQQTWQRGSTQPSIHCRSQANFCVTEHGMGDGDFKENSKAENRLRVQHWEFMQGLILIKRCCWHSPSCFLEIASSWSFDLCSLLLSTTTPFLGSSTSSDAPTNHLR